MARSVLSADHFHDEAAALNFIEARLWPNGPVCPRCGENNRVGRLNVAKAKIGMCKCYVCRKPFSVTNKTVMESSHIPLHVWLQGMYVMCCGKKGFSANQLHRALGITLKSAWFLGHRLREALRTLSIDTLDGDGLDGDGLALEVNETSVGGKAQNRAFGPIPSKVAVPRDHYPWFQPSDTDPRMPRVKESNDLMPAAGQGRLPLGRSDAA